VYLYSYEIYTQYTWAGCRGHLSVIRSASKDDILVNRVIHWEAIIKQVWRCTWRPSTAKCKSVLKLHTILPDTPVDHTGASMYFQILPGPPGAKHSALRLYKSNLRYSFWDSQILQLLNSLHRSAGDFKRS